MLDLKFRTGAKNDGAFDVVLKLANVARPVVLAEEAHGVGVNSAHIAAILLGVTVEEE